MSRTSPTRTAGSFPLRIQAYKVAFGSRSAEERSATRYPLGGSSTGLAGVNWGCERGFFVSMHWSVWKQGTHRSGETLNRPEI